MAIFTTLLCISSCQKPSISRAGNAGMPGQSKQRLSLEKPPSIFPGGLATSSICPEYRGSNVSPSDFELDAYRHRLVKGRLQSAIAINCVIYLYSPSNLRHWAAKGDPVAALADIIVSENAVGFSCGNKERVKHTLQGAVAVKVRDPISQKELSRVPEIYSVLDNIDFYCGDTLDPSNRIEAIVNGFDEEALSPIKYH
ncbi:hypothetical protein [Asticcacaulis taihuensis]